MRSRVSTIASWALVLAFLLVQGQLFCDAATATVAPGKHTIYTFHTGLSDSTIKGTRAHLSFDLCVRVIQEAKAGHALPPITFVVSNEARDLETLSHTQADGHSFCASFSHPHLGHDKYQAHIECNREITYTLDNVRVKTVTPPLLDSHRLGVVSFFFLFAFLMFIGKQLK
jgi:hypothetical protein